MAQLGTDSVIYGIRNTVSGKIYVGSAVNGRERWRLHGVHLNKGSHKNRHLQSAWDKYGVKAFVVEELEKVANKEDLLDREQYWIDHLNAADRVCGYNICPTAESALGVTRSSETRKKISESKKGTKASPETRMRLSECRKGSKHPMFGKKHAPESLAKMSEAHKGRKHSEETKRKIREANRGKVGRHSSEGLRRLSVSKMGKKNPRWGMAPWNKGRKGVYSEDTLKKMSEAAKRRSR